MWATTATGLLLIGLSFASSAQSPVTKVVELIEELKAKIEADGKMEQQLYDKYACWCETTSARKANDIHTAMSDIKSLSTKILELKGLVATRTSEIAQDSLEINDNQQAQDEATGIRQKENAAYMAAFMGPMAFGKKDEVFEGESQTRNRITRRVCLWLGTMALFALHTDLLLSLGYTRCAFQYCIQLHAAWRAS